MTRRLPPLALLIALAGCAGHLPPAPATAPVDSSVHDSLAPAVDLSMLSGAADALTINDLAAAAPDDALVPAFDARRVRWDIDVRTYANHPRVQYYLAYFQGLARSRMEVFLQRGARYEPMIRRRFEVEGLPGDLGYLALIESGYSSDAVSRAYAVGMWQFMRTTGRGYGLRVDSWVDERRDPVKATDAAARHLRDLKERFGSLYLAAAAYNAGAGKVSRSLGKLQWDEPADPPTGGLAGEAAMAGDSSEETESEDAPDPGESEDASEDAVVDAAGGAGDAAFFRLASNDLLAVETQDYVPKLIAAALIAKQPERFGFAPVSPDPLAYDSLVVSDAAGLDVIAELAGADLAELRGLNPQYLRAITPPRRTSVVRLPAGSGPTVAAGYADLSPGARVRYLTHVAGRRERLSSIAARYHLPASEVRRANPRLKGRRVAPGTRVAIPAAVAPSALAMRATQAAGFGRVHRVLRGETLSGIARRYRVSVRALRRANAISNDYALRAGARLRIPG